LKARYSDDYVVIASLYGRGEGFKADETPLPGDEIARVFSAATLDRYVMDLRKLPRSGALRVWFDTQQPVPTTLDPLKLYDRLALARAFDAIAWLGVVTPFRPGK